MLASEEEVISWIGEEMVEAGHGSDQQEIKELLRHIGRRSGLLLPRGADDAGRDLFVFMHL